MIFFFFLKRWTNIGWAWITLKRKTFSLKINYLVVLKKKERKGRRQREAGREGGTGRGRGRERDFKILVFIPDKSLNPHKFPLKDQCNNDETFILKWLESQHCTEIFKHFKSYILRQKIRVDITLDPIKLFYFFSGYYNINIRPFVLYILVFGIF